MIPPLLDLQGVSKLYGRRRPVRALDGVDLTIGVGEVLGLVGESGSGKSTLGRIAAGIETPSAGIVRWRGTDRATLPRGERKAAGLAVQMVFQDPATSLNARLRVQELIGEAPRVHGLVERAELRSYVFDLMQRVGLDPALAGRFPHALSGGQRQRVGIARALAVRPALLVCDEPVAALDVSVQAQVINLFADLRRDLGLAYLFISHDLAVVRHVSDRVAVLYLGRLVELAPTQALFGRPNHPYTAGLVAEIADRLVARQLYVRVRGEMPSPLAPPPGCAFHPRCPHAFGRCRVERPALREVAPGHWSACHLNEREAKYSEGAV